MKFSMIIKFIILFVAEYAKMENTSKLSHRSVEQGTVCTVKMQGNPSY